MKSKPSIREALLGKKKPKFSPSEGALSTGSTLLNLACSDHIGRGFFKGGYFYLVGDSGGGKTWLSLTCFAEATLETKFKDYDLIFDDVEGGALMDMESYFGKAVAQRVQPPAYKKGQPVFSETVEDFYYNLDDRLKQGRPFIYVLDSQDALFSKSAEKKFKQHKDAALEGEEVAGSYGDGKAKFHSEHLRQVVAGLRRTGSILIIIGQTRDNIGFGFDPKTRSGGRALRFYASLEVWTAVKGKIQKPVRGKPRTVGVRIIAEVKKNRITGKVGKDRSVEIPILFSYGIDDIGSCIDYLVSEKHWSKVNDKVIDAKEMMFEGTRSKLIQHIEQEGLQEKLRDTVQMIWDEVEKASGFERKRRYE